VKREKYPGTNEYIFELMLGINSALGFWKNRVCFSLA
jgi:hypothetical protein